MKKLVLLCLLAPALSAAAETVQGAGPGAGALPEKPAAARPAGKHDQEILGIIKDLSLLLEVQDRLSPEKLDALAGEMDKFNGDVKRTIGRELLEEAALKEKQAAEKETTAAAQKDLAALRSALQLSYVANDGKYPADLAALVPDRIQAVPELYLPGHKRTAEVKAVNSKEFDGDPGQAVTDDGGWLYFSDQGLANYGLVLINCSHKDESGMEFFKY